MGSDDRRSARANVILKATIEVGDQRIPVRISNLSAHGALVVGNKFPANDTPVRFCCNEVVIQGWVAWSSGGRAGIQFDSPVDPETLAQRDRQPPPLIVKDTRKVDFRRPGFRGNQMTDEERKIVDDWIQPKRQQSEKDGKSDS